MMQFDTPFTRMLGVRYPIMLGGLRGHGRAELAAAVSNAGGFGVITAGCFSSGAELRAEIEKTRSLTHQPFGVNISMNPGVGSDYGALTNEFVNVVCEEKPVAVETSGRSPEGIIDQLHAAGIKVIHKVPSARFAAKAERVGADMVSCIGYESGGHTGNDLVAGQIVLQHALELVHIPVICAGSVVDGKGFLAALAMGCAGVTMGTRFLISKESPAHPDYKAWAVSHAETDTMLVQRSIRNPLRVIKNDQAMRVAGYEAVNPAPKIEQIMPLITGKRTDAAMAAGDVEGGLYSCGQGIGLIHDIPSCAEIIQNIVSTAQECYRNMERMITVD